MWWIAALARARALIQRADAQEADKVGEFSAREELHLHHSAPAVIYEHEQHVDARLTVLHRRKKEEVELFFCDVR